MPLELAAGPARLVLDPDDGGRLTSLRLDDHELLHAVSPQATMHGSYVMAPYAGRVRAGRFTHAGHEVRLPLTLPPHGAHGLVLDAAWTVHRHTESTASLACAIGAPWPFGGTVEQQVDLSPQALRQTVTVQADRTAFPASIGWHPWFVRTPTAGASVRLHLDVGAMLVRDEDYVTTLHRREPTPGPWDDCFAEVRWPVVLEWPGLARLEVYADTDYVVVFDQRDDAVCVEPQTHPPDALNTGAALVRRGHPVRATTTWRWTLA
jgi:aldose 1-epimerase